MMETKLAEILFNGRPVIYIKEGGNFTIKDKNGKDKIVYRPNFIPIRYSYSEWIEGLNVTIIKPIYNKNKELIRHDEHTLTVRSLIKQTVDNLKGRTVKERVIIRGKIKYKKKKLTGILERINNLNELQVALNNIYFYSDTHKPIFEVKLISKE